MKSSKSKSSREIYTRLLLQKEHGYPLWIPEPDGCLPEAYRGKGVGVGDVGILRNDGGFDYLFNACMPADDPINKGRVPEGFEPIICADIREVETMHKRGSDIRSASVSRIEMSMGGAAESPFLLGAGGGFEFNCSREQGAILVLPDGGARYDALNLSQFRSYAARNAHAWYQFANIVCGREAVNGSLYLVTGCDKACSWGAASFFNPADTRSFSLKFLVGGVAEGNIKLGYSWKSASSADVRAYPDGESTYFVDSLRLNQCVFLRGFGISIRTNTFSQWVFGPREVSQMSGTSKDQLPCFDSSTPYSDVGRKRRRRASSAFPYLSPEILRESRKKSDPLSEPAPVSPPPSLARPLPPRQYYSSPNSTSPGWDTDYNEEQPRLGGLGMMPINVRAYWARNDGIFGVPRFPSAGAYAGSDFATQFAVPMQFNATPSVSSENGVLEDEFELEDSARITSTGLESRQEGDDASNLPTRTPTLPLTIDKHDVTTGGVTHNYQQHQQQPGTPLNQPWGSGVGFGRASEVIYNDCVRTAAASRGLAKAQKSSESFAQRPAKRKRVIPRQPVIKSEQYQDANVDENVPDKERKPELELQEQPTLHEPRSPAQFHYYGNSSDMTKLTGNSAENQHQIISSDMMKLTRDSATLSPYSFPPARDGPIIPTFRRHQVEGVASTSGVGTRGGPMEFQRSVLEPGDDTSSVRTSSAAQSSLDLADLTGIARSFRPQTELLNPCAKINEFILNTHPHVNVAITHSEEWSSSALSQGDDSDVLLRVLSDYKVIVRNGVAMLEAR